MGAIYKAKQLPLERPVALKVLRGDLADDEVSKQRFFREAKMVSQLSHPDIIILYDYGVDDQGLLFLAMEWLEGGDLSDQLRAAGAIEPRRAARFAMLTARTLAAAHRKGVIHRDLKPENIFLLHRESPNEPERIKVLDFGIAKIIGDDAPQNRLTQLGTVCGTPEFMSPEQTRGEELDGRSDIYSLGCVLHTMLTGRLPFPNDNIYNLMISHQRQPLPPLPHGFSAELQHVIDCATQKQQDLRYHVADDFADALQGYLDRSQPQHHHAPTHTATQVLPAFAPEIFSPPPAMPAPAPAAPAPAFARPEEATQNIDALELHQELEAAERAMLDDATQDMSIADVSSLMAQKVEATQRFELSDFVDESADLKRVTNPGDETRLISLPPGLEEDEATSERNGAFIHVDGIRLPDPQVDFRDTIPNAPATTQTPPLKGNATFPSLDIPAVGEVVTTFDRKNMGALTPDPSPTSAAPPAKKSSQGLLIVAIVLLIIVVVGAVFMFK